MNNPRPKMNCDRNIVILLVGITLLHGLLYVFLIPPWQHYDEPTHFELTWLTARGMGLSQANHPDLEIRRAIATSMREHEFFRDAGFEPPLEENGNIWLGISQIGNQPLYYYLAAIPVALLESQGVVAMLYGARLVSLFFLLISVIACWGIVAELTAPGHRLRFLLPLSLALLPGYVDVMTAVNNDSVAAGLAALSLWTSLHLFRRGPKPLTLLAAILLAGLIYFAKETAYPVVLLLGVALLFMLIRGRFAFLRPWIWIGLTGIVVLSLVWAIIPGDASAWYRITNQEAPTRAKNQNAVSGDYVFQFDTHAKPMPAWFSAAVFQPQPLIVPDRSQVFSLGAWAWSEQLPAGADPAVARLSLGFGNNRSSRDFLLTTEPTFIAITGTMTADEYKPFRVVLAPVFRKDSTVNEQFIYMDGIVLAQGEFPTQQPPEFDDIEGLSGVWGNQPFGNLARNPSAEQSGLRFRPILDQITARLLPDQTQGSLVLTSLLDCTGSRQYYASAAQWLIITFWGRFGWGHVPLLASPSVSVFAGYTFLAAMATIFWLAFKIRRNQEFLREFGSELIFLALALVIPWLSAYLRAPMYLGQVNLYLPVARYALAAIIPTILLLNLGFLQFYGTLDSKYSARGWIITSTWVGGWLAYALYALVSILIFYA